VISDFDIVKYIYTYIYIDRKKAKVKDSCLLTRANQTSSVFSFFFFLSFFCLYITIQADEHFLQLILTILLFYIY